MTQEEKAKAYDEALERMKSWVRGEHPECFTEAQKAAEFIFPELKESEDDGIRKELVSFLRKASGGFLDTATPCKTYSKWLAWLEKQDEKQKLDGTFVNVDEVRESFVSIIYSILSDDPTNDRANDIINAFDNLPSITISNV